MTKLATFAALKGYQLWDVNIGNNYYNGRYADYRFRAYPVIAGLAQEAKQTVLKYRDAVLADLKTKRYNDKRKMLPRGSALPISPNRIGIVEQKIILSTAPESWKRILCPKGWVQVQLTRSQITN